MEKSPSEFYQQQAALYRRQLKAVKKKLLIVGMLRLAVFALTGFIVYLLSGQTNLAIITGIVGLGFFLFIVSRNTDIKLEKRRLEKLIALNLLELKILNREVEGIDEGKEFIGETHHFNQDIDLFGEGSVFQYLNRTSTQPGKEKLAAFLNSNDISNVTKKQQAVQALKVLPEWRQYFQTTAALIDAPVEHKVILSWLKNYQNSIPDVFKWLPLVFSCLSVLIMGLFGFDIILLETLVMWLFIGIGITGVYFKRISKLYLSASQMTETFSQYAKLLKEIENKSFQAELLQEIKATIQTNDKSASAIFKRLSRELNSLDQRNNFLFAFVANGFFLWDLRYAFRIESWMGNYRTVTEKWFEAIADFDAFNSLGNFAFNHPDYVYPEIAESEKVMIRAEELGHPLLKKEQRVSNDFSINKEDFFIVTGANMAGKSTFLRTVAINLVLANAGLPVCAKAYTYSPIRLISSMRTSDSLMNDESYFFSELKRLKFIIDEIKTDRYFIILDEILKGTNSKDKEEGSKKFIEKLVGTNSTGIIATHDLSLCELSATLPQVENHYFDAEIVNNELYFDYRFKDGVCQNMNASFLLKKMEIV